MFKEPEIPGIGEKVDESFVVDLPLAQDGPRITVVCDAASVIISCSLIERIAAVQDTDWTTEEERLRLIAAKDARELLGFRPAGAGGTDGFTVPAAQLGHAVYLLSNLLKEGSCMVVPLGSSEAIPRIAVRYTGEHEDELMGFGDIRFMRDDTKETFLAVEWFVA